MTRTSCPVCGSQDLTEDVRPIGPHYGKRVCPQGHFIDWIPHPRASMDAMPTDLTDLIVPRSAPVPLRGTPAQVSAARSLRFNMLRFHSHAGRPDFVAMVQCVNDATWFLANKGRGPADLMCWPRAEQMEPVAEGAEL